MKSVLHMDPRTSNRTWNPYHESFRKPAVIIANHSSFLDTLSLGMLIPKGIFLVNDWVWNSPIFGRAVKALGFYPVSQGLENGKDILKDKVAAGYSLIVFPEGTRSYTNVVKRFHKGAFYLAQEFNLDIVPVYLLGNGDVLPKGDIMIFGGALNPVIGKRIQPIDQRFGKGYASRTKSINNYFREDYQQWRYKIEDANYFKKKILLAYYFKDEDIVNAVKSDFKQYAASYHALRAQLSNQRKIAHYSDTYGHFDYLLSLQHGSRKIQGLIPDDEKRSVAKSLYWSKQRQVKFLDLEVCDAHTLIVHPRADLSLFPIAHLQEFQEIYTFKEEALLQNEGWKSVSLDETLIRYEKQSGSREI